MRDDAIHELRGLLSHIGSVDPAHGRRLVLRAASRVPDLERASDLVEELGTALAMVELAPIIGADRQPFVQEALELLEEVEVLSRPI